MVCYAPSSLSSAEILLPFLPLIALILAAFTTWILRGRAVRTQWAVSASFGILIWIVTMGLSTSFPASVSFSVWQPERLFQSPLQFSLDQTSWAYMYASSTVLLAMIFTASARQSVSPADVRAFWFLYTALAMIAMLAANLVTLTISWALMDFLTLIFFLRYAVRPEDVQRALIRTGIDMAGVLLLLAGASMNFQAGGDTSITTAFQSTTGVLLVILAALFRLGVLPLHFGIPTFEPLRRGMGTLLRLFPPAVSMILLTRLFGLGLPVETRNWLMFVGIVGVLIGGIRWVLEDYVIESRPYFVLTISSLAVLAGVAEWGIEGPRAAGVAMLLIGAALSLSEIHSPVHRVWPILGAVILVGMPWSIGGVLGASFGRLLHTGGNLPTIIAGAIGMTLLGLGAVHAVLEEEIQWPSAETLVRVMFDMGVALPVLVSVGLGIWLQPVPGLEGIIVFAISASLGLLLLFVLRRLPTDLVQSWQGTAGRFDPQYVYRVLWRPLRILARIARVTGSIFEGEGALLWMTVVIVFIILALGVG
ncbi:MAG: hypothetical protein E4H01_12780 [Lysobacterales bacterium]|nr:MAG: hypothetical protein E4H01_12780 [Xanthomonadales bacterium]